MTNVKWVGMFCKCIICKDSIDFLIIPNAHLTRSIIAINLLCDGVNQVIIQETIQLLIVKGSNTLLVRTWDFMYCHLFVVCAVYGPC